MQEVVLELRHVSKSFGSLKANNGISISIRRGEIHALLGENGAGKSTLMKIIYGLYQRDSGSILVNGAPLPEKFSPLDAISQGITMVPQHVKLIDAFTVAQNILLGREESVQRGIYNARRAAKKVDELCSTYHISLNPDSRVETLSLGEKQKIEILKALYRESKILILDEPTAVLTPQEVESLFSMLRSLQQKGLTVILIAHKLEEVLEISNRITVLRQGEVVCTVDADKTTTRELANYMVGHELRGIERELSRIEPGETPRLTLESIQTAQTGERCTLKGLDLALYAGKIIGVAGIDGNGQTDLLEILAGVKPAASGSIRFCPPEGGERTLDQRSIRTIGMGIIPEDRLVQGLVLDLSMKTNLVMRRRKSEPFSKGGIFQSKAISQYADKLIEQYDVRPQNKELNCRYFSGGNQQKIVLARELDNPGLQIVVASQPTRGLDIGAQEFVYQTLMELRVQGKAILLISSDLDEIRLLSDYIAIIHEGRITANKPTDEITNEEIGLLMGANSMEGGAGNDVLA